MLRKCDLCHHWHWRWNMNAHLAFGMIKAGTVTNWSKAGFQMRYYCDACDMRLHVILREIDNA